MFRLFSKHIRQVKKPPQFVKNGEIVPTLCILHTAPTPLRREMLLEKQVSMHNNHHCHYLWELAWLDYH